MVDSEAVKIGLMLINMLVSVAMYFYVRADSRQRATVASIKELEEKMSQRFEEKSQHIGRLEIEIQRSPTRDQLDKERDRHQLDITRIHDRIDDLGKSYQQSQLLLGGIYEQLKQMNHHGNGHG